MILWICICCTTARAQSVSLAADSVCVLPAFPAEVDVRVSGFQSLIACQGTIEFDPQIVFFAGVTAFGLPGMNANSFGTTNVANGVLTFSWDDPSLNGVSLPSNSTLFRIQFSTPGYPGDTSSISFSNSPTPLEFVGDDFGTRPYVLEEGMVCLTDTTVGLGPKFSAFNGLRVYPNPLTDLSRVRIDRPNGVGELVLMGLDGSEIQKVALEADGQMELDLSLQQLFPDGFGKGASLLMWTDRENHFYQTLIPR